MGPDVNMQTVKYYSEYVFTFPKSVYPAFPQKLIWSRDH